MTETLAGDQSNLPADTEPSPPNPSNPPNQGRRPWFGLLLRRLHFYAGLLIGPFILVARSAAPCTRSPRRWNRWSTTTSCTHRSPTPR